MQENKEFNQIISEIIENDKINQLKKMSHHGINRFDHSLSVAYFSYKLAKYLKLDYKQAARGGMLHDFFETPEGHGVKVCFKSIVEHPDIALNNAKSIFSLREKEEDIIVTHMFPFGKHIPKCGESWVVNCVDKFLTLCEITYVASYRFNFAKAVVLERLR